MTWQTKLQDWIKNQHGSAGWEQKLEAFIQDLLDRKAEEIRKLKEPMEDDEETCLYRHCSEGDHWKCGGDGEGGRCVCRCHALDQAISILKEE